MRQRTQTLFPPIRGDIFLGACFLQHESCLNGGGPTGCIYPSVLLPTTSVVSYISILLGWLGVGTSKSCWLLWGLFLWGFWICWWIWCSRCSMGRAIYNQVDFVAEPAVAQRYPTASIHLHLILSVTKYLYDPPRLCPLTRVFTILVLDLDRVSDLKFLEWAAILVVKLFVLHVLLAIANSLSSLISFHCFHVWYLSLRTRRWSLMIWP